jgi:hypothetical protein
METIAYSGTEVSLNSLGVGLRLVLTLNTHGASTLSLPLPGTAPETAAVIPFEAPCVIYTGRTGSGTSWTGGSIIFQGRRTDNSGDVSGASVSTTLLIEDAWYDLRFLTLQAVWQIITGGTMASPTYGTATWPDCILFQATPGRSYSPLPVNSHITSGQAIVEILNYAITYGGVNLQIGTINPALYVPFYPVRSMRCADAIKAALRVHPDCTTEIDYTTTPPTFNIRARANLTALTLPFKGNSTSGGVTRTHLTSRIKQRPDLIPTRVGIYIKETSTEAGQTVVSVGTDIYPAVSIGLRSFDVSLDITGPKTAQVTGQVTTYAGGTAEDAFDGSESSPLAWWMLKVPAFSAPETVPGSLSLVNTAINDGSKNCITVVDESGNPINFTTYPNVMEHEGTIHPWMTVGGNPVVSIKAIVTGYFTYQRRKNIGTTASPIWITVKSPNIHPHPVRVHLTNSPLGLQNYAQTSLISTGEVYPTGLAEGIYNSLSALQYEFKHTILEQPFSTLIKPGKHSLNVTGGDSAWSNMAAMIQCVTIEFINSPTLGITSSKTTVSCGPVEHLEAGELVQLTNLFTNRDLSKINPAERSSGLPNGGANAGMPSETAKENTTSGEPEEGQQMFTAADSVTTTNFNGVQHDPANSQVAFPTYLPTSATAAGTGFATPTYYGAGAPSATTLPANVNFRASTTTMGASFYIDTTANAEWYCTTAGTNSTSAWTQLSGGGSSSFQQGIYAGHWGDGIWVIPFNNQVYGPVLIPVILPHRLRCGANAIGGPVSIRGGTYSYTYSAATAANVTINGITYSLVPYYTRNVTGSNAETNNAITDLIPGVTMVQYGPANLSLGSTPITIATVALTAGGSGYTAGTYSLTTGTGTKATVAVTVTGGVITGVTLVTSGNYSAAPTLTGLSITGGGGSGATFTVTLGPTNLLLIDAPDWAK